MPVKEAIDGAHVPFLDPAGTDDAEIRKGPRDAAALRVPLHLDRRSGAGRGDGARRHPDRGLEGDLARLDRVDSGAPEGEIHLAAGEARAALRPLTAEAGEADVVFAVGDELRAGYRGFLDCTR